MSLVGSLEDLGLGDILQIISLSRKSGVLLLRSDRGQGRIVFREGLIRGAFRKDDPTDLRGLVERLETVSKAELDAACEAGTRPERLPGRGSGRPFPDRAPSPWKSCAERTSRRR